MKGSNLVMMAGEATSKTTHFKLFLKQPEPLASNLTLKKVPMKIRIMAKTRVELTGVQITYSAILDGTQQCSAVVSEYLSPNRTSAKLITSS